MSRPIDNPWLHRFAVLTALATLALIAIGGLVTSHEVGMAVPDWPTTYGYNMFLFPISQWVGGIFYEHTHRLVATVVGVLVVALTRWLGGRAACRPLLIIGALELAAGFAMLRLDPQLKGAGYFLSGIGGVVFLAGAVWINNESSTGAMQWLGWLAFALVQIQGLLGGLRVVLYNNQIGIFHGALAQIFFAVSCVIALLTSRWWAANEMRSAECGVRRERPPHLRLRWEAMAGQAGPLPLGGGEGETSGAAMPVSGVQCASQTGLRGLLLAATLIIFAQLVLGATMRHQHAGLAIPDFPLAYHKLWPPMDAASVASYNSHRLDVLDPNPITAFQIGLQMAHRIMAVVIFCVVSFNAWSAHKQLGARHPVAKISLAWLGLIFLQIILGAATIWSNKAADIATGHVVVGALSLVTGALLTIISFRVLIPARVLIPTPPESINAPVVSNRPAVSGAK